MRTCCITMRTSPNAPFDPKSFDFQPLASQPNSCISANDATIIAIGLLSPHYHHYHQTPQTAAQGLGGDGKQDLSEAPKPITYKPTFSTILAPKKTFGHDWAHSWLQPQGTAGI